MFKTALVAIDCRIPVPQREITKSGERLRCSLNPTRICLRKHVIANLLIWGQMLRMYLKVNPQHRKGHLPRKNISFQRVFSIFTSLDPEISGALCPSKHAEP